jgi:DNA-binding LacI/PurR family transcriptional regulator
MESGYAAFSALRERVPDLTALFFSNDQMALGAFRAAYDHGLSVPEDISITGYDDTKYASFAVPALTTIRQPLSEVACAGVELVLERIRGDVPVRSVVLRPELKIRSSCRSVIPASGS